MFNINRMLSEHAPLKMNRNADKSYFQVYNIY